MHLFPAGNGTTLTLGLGLKKHPASSSHAFMFKDFLRCFADGEVQPPST
jgi:hypothetical protein